MVDVDIGSDSGSSSEETRDPATGCTRKNEGENTERKVKESEIS
jgi:hypothetical protein